MSARVRFRAGSCVVCGLGTDTVLAFAGEAEHHIAALQVLGVPKAQASETYRVMTGSAAGMVPAGVSTVAVRVCSECLSRSPFASVRPAVLMSGAEIPVIEEPR